MQLCTPPYITKDRYARLTKVSNGERSVEDDVPYLACKEKRSEMRHDYKEKHATGYTKAELEILVVVCKMVLFHLPHVARKHSMMEAVKGSW